MPAMQARTSFSVGRRIIRRGQLLDAKDPIIKGREHLFADPNEVVEQATAEPGEKRTVRRSRKTSSADDGED